MTMADDMYDFNEPAPSKSRGGSYSGSGRGSKSKGGPKDAPARGGGDRGYGADAKPSKERVTKEVIEASRVKDDDKLIDVAVTLPVASVTPKKAHQTSTNEEDEYGDDDFEDYGDDFEDDEASPAKLSPSLAQDTALSPAEAPAPSKSAAIDHRQAKGHKRTQADDENNAPIKEEKLGDGRHKTTRGPLVVVTVVVVTVVVVTVVVVTVVVTVVVKAGASGRWASSSGR